MMSRHPPFRFTMHLPSIKHPGAQQSLPEKVEWVSHLVEQVWPYLQRLFESTLVGTVQPALAATMPASFPRLHFTKMVLGDTPPRVQGVRVSAEYKHSIAIELDILYDGHPQISMSVGKGDVLSFGIEGLRLEGIVEVVLAPLLTEFPIYGAVSISFVNSPEVSYDLTGLATAAETRLLQKPFKKAFRQVLASLFVLPNRFVYKLVPTLDYFKFAVPLAALLRVTVVRGNGFPNTDEIWWKRFLGIPPQPDVYLEIRMGATARLTKRVDDQNDPIWEDEVHDFILSSHSKSQKLNVYAYDYNVGIDEFVGKGSVPLGELVVNDEVTIPLKGTPLGAKPTVTLRADMLQLSSTNHDIRLASLGADHDSTRLILTIMIDEARGLESGCRPYVEVSIDEPGAGETFSTWVVYDIPGIQSAANPDWEQEFHYVLKKVNPAMKINFEVKDASSRRSLGSAFCSLSSILLNDTNENVFLFSLMGAPNPSSTLRVKVVLVAVSDRKVPLPEFENARIRDS